jgi:hypothetical protein
MQETKGIVLIAESCLIEVQEKPPTGLILNEKLLWSTLSGEKVWILEIFLLLCKMV